MLIRIDEDITFRKLEILLAFMETGNLARAAERLDISTVSVHRALHSLETGMRCALFRHEGRNLHPTDAAARGLAEGAIARLANDQGELLLPVHVADKAPPGVAIAVKGAWPKLDAHGRNVNVLHAGRKADMGESTAVHGIEVTVTAAG